MHMHEVLVLQPAAEGTVLMHVDAGVQIERFTLLLVWACSVAADLVCVCVCPLNHQRAWPPLVD